MISPLSIASDGYISPYKFPLSVATNGYLSVLVLAVINLGAGGGGGGFGVQIPTERVDNRKEMLLREDEEMLLLMKIFIIRWAYQNNWKR